MTTQTPNARTERALKLGKHQIAYENARRNLLLMIILSAVNIVLSAANLNVMMLFSATVPYFAVLVGLAGETPSAYIVSLIFAAICLLIYLACWLLSKKSSAWMVVATVLFVIDTAFMVWLYITAADFSGILDAVIHAYILYSLIVGVINAIKLKRLPEIPEEELIVESVSAEETIE